MMHDDQLMVDGATARELIAGQFPQYRHLPVRQLAGSGTVNAIFRVGDSITARFPLQPQQVEKAMAVLRSEAAAASEFAAHAPFPAPRPLGIGQAGRRYPMPWTLQTWLDGDTATPDGLAASSAFAGDIAHLIATLRHVDPAGRSFDGIGRGGDLASHDEWMATCFANSNGPLDVPRLECLWSRLRALPPKAADRMCHKDLIPANLLVRDGRLAGILDTGSFGPADPALDLVSAWHLFDADCRNIIRTRLASRDLDWRRGAAWAFIQAMGLVWYYRTSNPTMSALGHSTLARLLADPEITAL